MNSDPVSDRATALREKSMSARIAHGACLIGCLLVFGVYACPRSCYAESQNPGPVTAGRDTQKPPVHVVVVSGPTGDGGRVAPGWAPGAEQEAQRFLERGDVRKAEEAVKRAFDLTPTGLDRWKANSRCTEILGEIRLLQGRPAEARDLLLLAGPNHGSVQRDLDLALAYCRLGDYANALAGYRFIATHYAFPELLDEKDPDRPGWRKVREIEASVLLAKAQRLHSFLPEHGEAELRAAEKLIPTNAAVAYELGKVLQENKRYGEAEQRFRRAAANGHGWLAADAAKKADSAAYWGAWHKAHPSPAQAGGH